MKQPLSDLMTLWRGSLNPVVASVFLINTALRIVGLSYRITRFPAALIEIKGVKYFVDSWDGLGVLCKSHEPAVHQAISRELKLHSGGLFVNVGAHIGRYALGYAHFFDYTYAFEPTPHTYELLRRSWKIHPYNKRIILSQLGISDQHGKISLKLSIHESQNSITQVDNCLSTRTVSILTAPLDSVIPREQWSILKLLLIDAEGAEVKILLGAKSLLEHSPAIVVMEALTPHMLVRQSEILIPLGFSFYQIDKTNYLWTKQSLI